MNNPPNVLWLSMSPYLKCFDQRLLSQLVKNATVRRWEYQQSVDEPCCLRSALDALHEYVSDRTSIEADLEKSFGHPASKIHLAGHGVSGIIALLYAQQYPEHVASLTLLSVAAKPAINWQAHYYALRQLLPCSREMVLAQMTRLLLGHQPIRFTRALSQLLAKDLDSNITLHSLAHHTQISPGQVSVPVLVCNGAIDAVIGSQDAEDWHDWQPKETSNSFQRWHCPEGNHFFHFFHAGAVADVMSAHWQSVSTQQNQSPLLRNQMISPRITQLASAS